MSDTRQDSRVFQSIEELTALVRQQGEAIKNLDIKLHQQLKNEISNSTKQLEAYHSLQALIGDLPAPIHGKPFFPDFALQLVRLIRDQKYDLIVEFGSGISTLMCLKAFEAFDLYPELQSAFVHRLIAFEHCEIQSLKTYDLIDSSVKKDLLDLRLCPLESWLDSTASYSYCSGTDSITNALKIISDLVGRSLKLMVIIDAPIDPTCHWARFPAIQLSLTRLAN